MKDSLQKQKAIRYCVAAGLVPCLEVLVRYEAEVSDHVSDITDVDVLGIRPAGVDSEHRTLFDCKTLAKVSAINRALWAAGLKQLLKADDAFVILLKPAPDAHRLAANKLGVRLFSEPLFDGFATATSKDYFVGSSYLENIAAWESIFAAKGQYPALAGLINFLTAEAPLQANATSGFRNLLSQFKRTEGEFDPSKPIHRAIFGMMLTQAMVFLSSMVCEFHNVFDLQADETSFEKTLRYYVWGGKESFDLRHRLGVALQAAKGVPDPMGYDLPGWQQFKELVRAYLNAPFTLKDACLPMKDMAFRELVEPNQQVDFEVARRISANNRVRQFSLLLINYFAGLSRLTKECCDTYTKRFGELNKG